MASSCGPAPATLRIASTRRRAAAGSPSSAPAQTGCASETSAPSCAAVGSENPNTRLAELAEIGMLLARDSPRAAAAVASAAAASSAFCCDADRRLHARRPITMLLATSGMASTPRESAQLTK